MLNKLQPEQPVQGHLKSNKYIYHYEISGRREIYYKNHANYYFLIIHTGLDSATTVVAGDLFEKEKDLQDKSLLLIDEFSGITSARMHISSDRL